MVAYQVAVSFDRRQAQAPLDACTSRSLDDCADRYARCTRIDDEIKGFTMTRIEVAAISEATKNPSVPDLESISFEEISGVADGPNSPAGGGLLTYALGRAWGAFLNNADR
jgi:hypothetical protein